MKIHTKMHTKIHIKKNILMLERWCQGGETMDDCYAGWWCPELRLKICSGYDALLLDLFTSLEII